MPASSPTSLSKRFGMVMGGHLYLRSGAEPALIFPQLGERLLQMNRRGRRCPRPRSIALSRAVIAGLRATRTDHGCELCVDQRLMDRLGCGKEPVLNPTSPHGFRHIEWCNLVQGHREFASRREFHRACSVSHPSPVRLGSDSARVPMT